MADLHVRPSALRTVLRRGADELVVWTLGAVAAVAGALAGLTFVFAVYGDYGARGGVFTTLALAGLVLVAIVATAVFQRRRRRAVAPAPLVAALRELPDVRVTVDRDFGVGAMCGECGVRPAVVRVYGEPATRHLFPLQLAEVCARDALTAAHQALSEQDEQSRSPITIEVAA